MVTTLSARTSIGSWQTHSAAIVPPGLPQLATEPAARGWQFARPSARPAEVLCPRSSWVAANFPAVLVAATARALIRRKPTVRFCIGSSGDSTGSDAVATTPGSADPQVKEQEAVVPVASTGKRNAWAYLFQRLVEDLSRYTSSPRRDFTYWLILGASAILAVASDFCGVMRFLLSLSPEAARQSGLDQVYEVQGLKTFHQTGQYRLRYPGTWLFDQSVAFSKQAAKEVPTFRKRRSIVPDAAFGPPGGGIRPMGQTESLSVVVQPIQGSENLDIILGDPERAFQKLVAEALAQPGSGRSVEMLAASRRTAKAAGSSRPSSAYDFEYKLSKGEALLHTWSTVSLGLKLSGIDARPLYTLTVVAPEASLTPERRKQFEDCWQSFELEDS